MPIPPPPKAEAGAGRLVAIAAALMFWTLNLAGPTARAEDPSPDITTPPPFDEFLVIPLRLHILTAEDCPDLNCTKLTDADLKRIVGKVNRIWNVAGIHFGLESIKKEPAADVEHYKMARAKAKESGEAVPLGLFRRYRPAGSQDFGGFHVYYLHKFSVNGVYLGNRVAFVQETAALRPVPGGIDEPIPRVTAHELGHGLSLPHRQDRTNLLASGTTGTLLNRAEVEQTRKAARRLGATRTVAQLENEARAAETAGKSDEAARLRGWLAEIPRNVATPGPKTRQKTTSNPS